MILVLTDSFDVHADKVVDIIRRLNGRVFRLNLDVESLRKTLITYKGSNYVIEVNGELISTDSISSIWARRLTVSEDLETKTRLPDVDYALWKGEWNRHLFGIYSCLRGKRWLNPIEKATLADNKIFQIKEAEACGFNIPNFICSNNRRDLIEFSNDSDIYALKFLCQETFRTPNNEYVGLYVNAVTRNSLVEFGEAFENPILLQKYVPKQYEVRYTYIGGRHFVCKIDSQRSERAAVDWRRYDLPNTPHMEIVAPSEVSEAVNKLMGVLGLGYGAFDFVVDPDDRWWYLEVNSGGQWLWIEDLTGLPISDAIAEFLMEGED